MSPCSKNIFHCWLLDPSQVGRRRAFLSSPFFQDHRTEQVIDSDLCWFSPNFLVTFRNFISKKFSLFFSKSSLPKAPTMWLGRPTSDLCVTRFITLSSACTFLSPSACKLWVSYQSSKYLWLALTWRTTTMHFSAGGKLVNTVHTPNVREFKFFAADIFPPCIPAFVNFFKVCGFFRFQSA